MSGRRNISMMTSGTNTIVFPTMARYPNNAHRQIGSTAEDPRLLNASRPNAGRRIVVTIRLANNSMHLMIAHSTLRDLMTFDRAPTHAGPEIQPMTTGSHHTTTPEQMTDAPRVFLGQHHTESGEGRLRARGSLAAVVAFVSARRCTTRWG